MKVTAYCRDVVRKKHPGIDETWILRVITPMKGLPETRLGSCHRCDPAMAS
jgi:hypothetical protein